MTEPHAVAAQLQDLAKTALMPAPEQTALLQRSLGHLVRLYRDLQESIGGLDRELAYWLARTPGALLTTISGIGVTLAAGWMAELGPPNQWRALRRMSAYAGVVPRTKQSGGPDKAPQTLSIRWVSGGKWSKNFTRWNYRCLLNGQRAKPARQFRRVRRRRDGARDWDGAGLIGSFFGHCGAWQRALSVLGQNTSRTAPVRSTRVIATPLRGFGRKLLKDTSIR